MMNKKIYILCDHGLGNRIGSLIGGLTFAKTSNFTPIICWPVNNWCNAEFTDLFDSNFILADTDFSKSLVDQIQDLGLHYFFVSSFVDNYISKNHIDFNDIANETNDIIYSQCKIPKRIIGPADINNALSSLKIKKNILDKVYNFCKTHEINDNTIGIHLRKTDGSSVINDEEVFEEIKNSPNTKYYICSDSNETENKFLQLKNVCANSKNSTVKKITEAEWRDSVFDKNGEKILFNVNRPKEQIIDALIDILILSRTRIDKRAKSTFCTAAQYYSRINLFF